MSTRSFRASSEAPSNLPSSFISVPPEEVLFRRFNAPTRYAEHDIYFVNEQLRPDQTLPDSDLLKAIHAYVSDFYTNATADRGRCVWSSMDETALIALGILLEETAVEALGETGDMVFVEGEEISGDEKSGYESGWSGKTSSVGTGKDDRQPEAKRRRLSASGRSNEKSTSFTED